jgi:hypothetical protein
MTKQSQKAKVEIPSTIGEHTQPDINAWKQKYADIRKFTQDDEDGNTHVTYFRVPEIADISYSSTVSTGEDGNLDGSKFGLTLANEVRLGGSDAVMEHTALKRGYMAAVLKLARPIEGKVEKL